MGAVLRLNMLMQFYLRNKNRWLSSPERYLPGAFRNQRLEIKLKLAVSMGFLADAGNLSNLSTSEYIFLLALLFLRTDLHADGIEARVDIQYFACNAPGKI